MKNDLIKLIKLGIFPNNKNRVWAMCQVVIKLMLATVEEAEKNNLTNEPFYIAFLSCLNTLAMEHFVLNTFKDDSI